jgi:DNA-binding response OmpR family regulator
MLSSTSDRLINEGGLARSDQVSGTDQGSDDHRALIVDDDPATVELIKVIIEKAGMQVFGAYSGSEALQVCADVQPHVILLDLMMPGMDGWETFQGLRQITNAPIILVSANMRKENVVESLQMGFDDYLTKPFFPPELVARIKAVLRRASHLKPITVRIFPEIGLMVDFENSEVVLRDQPIQLTSREFAMLAILARNAPRMVKYERISAEIWGEEYMPQSRNRLKYLAYLIRRKIERDPARPELILNREGLGYQLNTEPV